MLSDLLLQATEPVALASDSIAAATEAAVPVEAHLSVWDLCLKGGFIMIPLALLLVVSIYIFFERYMVISRAERSDDSFMSRIKDYIHDGELESAKKLCTRTNTPYSRLILKTPETSR